MKVEMWAVARIRPYRANPRRIPQEAVDAVAASIEAFGWLTPIVVDEDGVILGGQIRLLAAKKRKDKNIPVYQVSGLTDAQKHAYRIADKLLWGHGALNGANQRPPADRA